jgi:hypothetical protein
MARFIIALLAAASALITTAHAAQYEPTLLPERSLRYRTSFGLFEDDFEGFIRPRYATRWDGARLASHLTQLTPQGEAALGYGRGATDAWSWSALAGGGYFYNESYRSGLNAFTAGRESSTAQTLRMQSRIDDVPATNSAAHAALGLSRNTDSGAFGFGLQARWMSLVTRSLETAPTLFTLPSPETTFGSERTIVSDLDTGALFEETSFRRSPQTDRRSLRAALVGGYASRPSDRGWGWALDLLAGIHQQYYTVDFESRDTAFNTSGESVLTYKTNTQADGLSPLAGGAVTLVRGGPRPFWIDLGGEVETGYSLSGRRSQTTANREVFLTTGGASRSYSLRETRDDIQDGTLGKRELVTIGIRQSLGPDPLLQLGWGLHASWQRERNELSLRSVYNVSESLDETGAGELSQLTRAEARGESLQHAETMLQVIEATLPLALVIRSASDPALEWRLGSELRYRNEWVRERTQTDSVLLPTGFRVDSAGASSPVRYGDATLPSGGQANDRTITVNTAVRAGVGYWFTSTAKVDAMLSAASTGDGFLDLDDRSIGLSALLAF